MSRRLIGNIISSTFALLVGAFTIYLSMTRLKEPQIPLDWAALIFSGLTTATLTFFITWGHFQTDPLPPQSSAPPEPPKL